MSQPFSEETIALLDRAQRAIDMRSWCVNRGDAISPRPAFGRSG